MICKQCEDAADNGEPHEECGVCDCQHAPVGDERYIPVLNESLNRRAQ